MSGIEFDKSLKGDFCIKLREGLPMPGWLETTFYQKVEARGTKEVLRTPIRVVVSSPADKFKEG
jgi:hypothetical protein